MTTAGTTKEKNSWQNATTWIQRNGGYINPLLDYDSNHRQVFIRTAPKKDTSTTEDPRNACLNGVDDGDVLMRIPDACLLSLHSVEANSFGKSLFVAVHSLQPPSDEEVTRFAKRARLDTKVLNNGHDEEGPLYNDEQDVILALFLAYLMEQLKNEGTKQNESSPNEASWDKSTNGWSFFRPYLETLCTNQSSSATSDPIFTHFLLNNYTDLLPRQWPIDMIERRLQGTSLYNRVLAEKNGLIREYKAVQSAWIHHTFDSTSESIDNGLKVSCFPSLESYDITMALVTSRGFAGLGYDGVDVMVPLLDLLNHVRGRFEDRSTFLEESSDSGLGGLKYYSNDGGGCIKADTQSSLNVRQRSRAIRTVDVRYERYENDSASGVTQDEKSSLSRFHFQGQAGGVKVFAARHLSPGTHLHMTYGAKGNSTLLGRYGFCIENNDEPDGSCNDVLEIQVRPNTLPIQLQRGPKLYSYSPFVEALELFHNKKEKADCGSIQECSKLVFEEGVDNSGDTEKDYDLEAFLNECDNDSGDDVETFDYYVDKCEGNHDSIEERTLQSDSQQQEKLEADISALKSLIKRLTDVKFRCETNLFARSDRRKLSSQEQYCSILVQSEIQTLSFFLAVSKSLKHQLVKRLQVSSMKKLDSKSVIEIDCSLDDVLKDINRKHIVDVVSCFLTIRYSPSIEF